MVTRHQKLSGLLRTSLSAALFAGIGLVLLPITGFTADPSPLSTYTGHKHIYDNCIDICPDYEAQYYVDPSCYECHLKPKPFEPFEAFEPMEDMVCTRP